MCRFVSEVPSGRRNNYPESGRGLGHVTPTIFGIRSNMSLKLLELETSNLMYRFVWAMPSRRINNFPESRRGLGHLNFTIFGSTVGYPSDSLASCFLATGTCARLSWSHSAFESTLNSSLVLYRIVCMFASFYVYSIEIIDANDQLESRKLITQLASFLYLNFVHCEPSPQSTWVGPSALFERITMNYDVDVCASSKETAAFIGTGQL